MVPSPGNRRPQLDGSSPRIVSPVDASIIALDPDIPRGQQRIMFATERSVRTLRWWLDGHEQCSTAIVCMWAPQAGHHTLTLVSASGRKLDRVSFTVRGSAPVE
jgi:penicillin-binding protein 1C